MMNDDVCKRMVSASFSLFYFFFSFQLDYKVDSKKLKQVFKLAGRVISVDLAIDQEGSSRGFAVVEYDHPVEAVQAISMFDHQMLYDRRMTVRLDRIPEKEKLPEGLGGIGLGLGPNGEPLRNVALNLSSLQNPNNVGINSNSGNNAPVPVAAPPPLSAATMLGQNTSSNLSSLAALNNVVGNLNSLNPLLSLGLSTLAGNTNDSNNSALDIAKIVGSGGNASGGNNLGVGSNVTSGSAYSTLGNLGNLNASNRMESNLNNPYANNYNSLQNLNSNNLNSSNSGGNYVSAQRDFDMNNAARSYSQQTADDFVRLNTSQSFQSSQLGNGTGANQQNNQRSISDTILIRNVSSPYSGFLSNLRVILISTDSYIFSLSHSFHQTVRGRHCVTSSVRSAKLNLQRFVVKTVVSFVSPKNVTPNWR